MNITQLSVFIENKPGRLQKVLKVLADEKINIISLTIAEMSDFGLVRMIVNDTKKAQESLQQNNIACSIVDVLAIKIGDEPGSLYNAIDAFAKMDLNIEYMYAFSHRIDNSAVMIFRFNNMETAVKAINGSKHTILRNADIIGE